MKFIFIYIISLLFFTSGVHASGTYPLDDPDNALIGANRTHIIQGRQTLIDLAREYNIGYSEIIDANQDMDPWVPEVSSTILIPTAWLLPEVIDEGIIINLAEMRLYYFFDIKGKKYVKTYPLGIGKEGFDTPTGTYRITGKVKDPVWEVPATIRKENPELPGFVPPGPDNPLGSYWLQLSIKGYGIHGTNRPYGIGRRVSHGCIRLYPEDIKVLSEFIGPGTMVKIIDSPVKSGMCHGRICLEVHRAGRKKAELAKHAIRNLSGKNLLRYTDTGLLIQAIKSATGLPAVISK